MEAARSFDLVGDSRIEAIRQACDIRLAAWCADWGVPAGAVQARVRRGDPAALAGHEGEATAPAWRRHAAHAWVGQPEQLPALVSGLLYPPLSAPGLRTHAGPADGQALTIQGQERIADLCAQEAAQALASLLEGLLKPSPSDADAEDGHDGPVAAPGRTWLLLELRQMPGQVLLARLCTEPAALEVAVPAAPALPSLQPACMNEALRSLPAVMEVELGRTELPLGELLSLRPGDVVPLDRPIHEPLLLRSRTDATAVPVHLGRLGSRYAVQVLRMPSSTASSSSRA